MHYVNSIAGCKKDDTKQPAADRADDRVDNLWMRDQPSPSPGPPSITILYKSHLHVYNAINMLLLFVVENFHCFRGLICNCKTFPVKHFHSFNKQFYST